MPKPVPLNFCLSAGTDVKTKHLMNVESLIGLAKRLDPRFIITGVLLTKLSTEDELSQICRLCPTLHSLDCVSAALCSISALKPCKEKLQTLVLHNSGNLEDISILEECPALRTLRLTWAPAMKDFSSLAACERLREVDLFQCPQLSQVPVSGGGRALQKLNLGCASLESLSGLQLCLKLESLDLSWCQSLEDISLLAMCNRLQNLNLCHCNALSDIWPLSALKELQKLNLARCSSLTDILPLTGCICLWELKLFACESLTSVAALSGCRKLALLDISFCHNLKDTSDLKLPAHCTLRT